MVRVKELAMTDEKKPPQGVGAVLQISERRSCADVRSLSETILTKGWAKPEGLCDMCRTVPTHVHMTGCTYHTFHNANRDDKYLIYVSQLLLGSQLNAT